MSLVLSESLARGNGLYGIRTKEGQAVGTKNNRGVIQGSKRRTSFSGFGGHH